MAKASGKGAANVLEVSRIYKTFNAGTVNEKKALQGLSLKLNEGDFVTVIGGNGAGKPPAERGGGRVAGGCRAHCD